MPLEDMIEECGTALTVKDVAEILKVSRRLIYQLVQIGEIPHFRVGEGGAVRAACPVLLAARENAAEGTGKGDRPGLPGERADGADRCLAHGRRVAEAAVGESTAAGGARG